MDISAIHFSISMPYISGYQCDTFLDLNVITCQISILCILHINMIRFLDIHVIHFWISMWYISGYQILDINEIHFWISFWYRGPSWPWLYGSCIYNYRCNQYLPPLVLWVRIPTGRWFSSGPPVSSTNKTDRHNIAKILLKVALNTIKQTNNTNQVMSHEWDCDYEKHLWHKYFVSLLKMFV